MLRRIRTLVGVATAAVLLAAAGCSSAAPESADSAPVTAETPAPSAAVTPSAQETPTPSPSKTGYPEATVEVDGSPKTDGKAEKEAVEVAERFLIAFNKSFTTGEVQPEIFTYAPTLSEPMRDALAKDKKKEVSYAGPARYTMKTVSANKTDGKVAVCTDLTEAIKITDATAAPEEKKPLSQQVRMTYGATPMYRGYMVEQLATVDADYC